MARQCAVLSPTTESMILAGNSPKPALQPAARPVVSSQPPGPYRRRHRSERNRRVLNAVGWCRSCILSPVSTSGILADLNGTAHLRRGSSASANFADQHRGAGRRLRPHRGSRPATGRHAARSGRARRLRRHRHAERRRSEGHASPAPTPSPGGGEPLSTAPRWFRTAGRVAPAIWSRRTPGGRRFELQGAQRCGVEPERAAGRDRAAVGRRQRDRGARHLEPGTAGTTARRRRPSRGVRRRARALGQRDGRPLSARCRAPVFGRARPGLGGHRRTRMVSRAREPVAAREQPHVAAHVVLHPAGARRTRAPGRARRPAASVLRARGVSTGGNVARVRRGARSVRRRARDRCAVPVRQRAIGL